MTKRPGQAALVVILVALVGLTVAVSVLGRSATTVNISTKEEERARSFSAAEAGIEDALQKDLALISGNQQFDVGTTSRVNYSVAKTTDVSAMIFPGETVTVDWDKSSATEFTLTWDSPVKLVATIIKVTGGNVQARHIVETGTSKTITHEANDKFVRIKFIGGTTTVRISGNAELSFYKVDATGTSGESTSKVEVTKSLPTAISLLDVAIFSGGGIQ